MFKPKEKTVFYVDYRDLEDLIKEVYGHEFNIPYALDSGNDTAHTIILDGYQDAYDVEAVQKFRDFGQVDWIFHSLMQDMARKGVLPKGFYVVEICW